MNKEQLKNEINKQLDNLPDKVLNDILAYLVQIGDRYPDTSDIIANFNRIILEDKELLERLAK
jgi:hypothetical protein